MTQLAGNTEVTPEPVKVGSGVDALVSWLRGVRRTAWAMLVAQRIGWVVAGVIGAIVVGGVLDYFLRAPMGLRLGGLLAALAALTLVVWRFILPAVRFNPSLTEVALRIERSEAGQMPGIAGVLASGLELGTHENELSAPALARPVVGQAATMARSVKAMSVFRPGRAAAGVGIGALALFAALGLGAREPELSRIGLSRMLTPWSGAEWPKRTGIADATEVKHHPLGSALALRALLTSSDRPADQTRVAATYRIITDGVAGPKRRVLLTDQGRRGAVVDAQGAPVAGEVFERLIEPMGLSGAEAHRDARATTSIAARPKMELEYSFETDDDESPLTRIMLVEPPRVVRATASVTLPEYAAKLLAAAAGENGGAGLKSELDLGPGSDERAAPAPILAGSRVRLNVELNKPVPASGSAAWIERALGPEAAALFDPEKGAAADAKFESAPGNSVWTLSWKHGMGGGGGQGLRLAVKPVDEHGIGAGEEALYRLDVLSDNAPSASVTTPSEDKSVLPTAVVELVGEGRDDVGLAWVALERQLARRVKGSESGAAEAVEERAEITRVVAEAAADAGGGSFAAKRLIASTNLDLSTLDLKAGDELWITALAADAYELDGARHEPARSTVRKLRIMSRDQLVEQIWSELGGVRRSAIRIDQDQVDAAKAAAQKGEEAMRRAERAQAGLSERLARQNEAIKRLQQRVSENGLTDQSVQQVLRDAKDILERAGQESTKAAASLNESAKQQSQESAAPEAGEKERQEAQESQEGVRDEMSNLIDLLDQGEDTFASKRALERMIEQQKALAQKTQQAGQTTTGKSEAQLSPQEKEQLEQIAQEQRQLGEQLKEAVRKMQEREEKLRSSDPAAAQAMAQAAKRAEREQVAEKMEQAAQQAQKNQTNNAQQQQQQAAQAMEQMLKELDQANDNRDEVLRRYLASLIESIEALIQRQQQEINLLKERQATADFKGLDTSMAALHQNTLGVLEEASNGPREVAPVAGLIGKAADSMVKAITGLKANPVVEDVVQQHEEESLAKLQDAKKAAERLNNEAKNRQESKKRAELRGKYEDALKKQVSVKDAADGLVGQESNRRTKAAARLAGQDQEAVRQEMAELRRATKELNDAKVFDFAHTRLEELMTGAAAKLNAGEVDAGVVRSQASAVRVLKSLVDSLDDRKKSKDPFRKAEGGGGGGGGGSGGQQQVVPPAAEIALLRAMQQEAAEMTRVGSEGGAAGGKPDPAVVGDAAKLQRELAEQAAGLLKKLSEEGEGGGDVPTPRMKPVPKQEPKDEGGGA